MNEHAEEFLGCALADTVNDLWTWGHVDKGTDAEDPAIIAAGVRSYQEFFKPHLDWFGRQEHGRAIVADGEIGPATARLLNMPRCSCPDHEEARGSARNWPEECRFDIGTHYKLRLNLKAEVVDERWQAALAEWNRAVGVRLHVVTDRSDSRIWATSGPISGSTLAWSQLAQNSCSAKLEERYNTRINWTGQYFQAVAAHELGHALGLGHIQDSRALLYPYARKDIYQPTSLDIKQLKRQGYGDPIETPDPPTPKKTFIQSTVVTWSDGTVNRHDSGGGSTDGEDDVPGGIF